jgi:hypothetical protein
LVTQPLNLKCDFLVSFFKFNLYRYVKAFKMKQREGTVGLCKLNQVDPQLESAWFQTLSLIK